MTRSKLDKLRKEIAELRRAGGVASSVLERLAKAVGRRRHKRGSEPTWVSEVLPDSYPLTIPHHSKDLNRFTARNILDHLEGDLDILEKLLDHGGKDE